jgi:hypothetical protein
MATHIIELNGQRLATNLYWQNLSDSAHVRKEIISAGREAETDMVCVPAVRNPIQAGYITRAELPKGTGYRSLAGGLAECHTGSWIGMFDVPNTDKYYFIAIQNDHILASSDIVGEFDEIKKIFEQTLSCGGWQYVSVPEGLNPPGVTVNHLTLAEMLTQKAPKIKPLEFHFKDLISRKVIFTASGLLVIGIAIFAYSSYQAEQERKKQEEARRLLMQQELARKSAANQALLTPPWRNAVPVDRLLEACAEQWKKARYSINGWEMTTWACNSNQVTASYDKAPLASATQLLSIPGISLSADGHKASLMIPIKIPGTGSLPATKGLYAKAYLMDYSESHLLTTSFQLVPPPPVLPGKESEAPPPPPWSIDRVAIDSTYPLFGLVELTKAPGLIIKRLTVEVTNGVWKWHVEGELYVIK